MVLAMEILRSEYSAEPGSFLLTARVERRWDPEAFQRLQRAMLEVCREVSGHDSIERWIADCFWYVEGFVREDCAHPAFPQPVPGYYEAAKRRTFDLSSWLFTGQCPHQPSYEWPDL